MLYKEDVEEIAEEYNNLEAEESSTSQEGIPIKVEIQPRSQVRTIGGVTIISGATIAVIGEIRTQTLNSITRKILKVYSLPILWKG